MSDVMLHGVLCMPPEMWGTEILEQQQRYGRYLQASRRIKDDGIKIDRLLSALRKLVNEPQDITSKAYQHALGVLGEFEGNVGIEPPYSVGSNDGLGVCPIDATTESKQ